jgi:hypothetical protein
MVLDRKTHIACLTTARIGYLEIIVYLFMGCIARKRQVIVPKLQVMPGCAALLHALWMMFKKRMLLIRLCVKM